MLEKRYRRYHKPFVLDSPIVTTDRFKDGTGRHNTSVGSLVKSMIFD